MNNPPGIPAKGCECVIHDGPHWLHADTVSMRLNLAQLQRVTGVEGLRLWGYEEYLRLGELEMLMLHAGMSPQETIEQYLRRNGWPATTIARLLRERGELRAAMMAALDRLMKQERTVPQLQEELRYER